MNNCVLLPPKRLCRYSGMVVTLWREQRGDAIRRDGSSRASWRQTRTRLLWYKYMKGVNIVLCGAASPQMQCKWAGRAIPAAAPSAYPVQQTATHSQHSNGKRAEQITTCFTVTAYLLCLTFHSYAIAPIPAAAPDPARPIKCPLPMLLANSEAPT